MKWVDAAEEALKSLGIKYVDRGKSSGFHYKDDILKEILEQSKKRDLKNY